MTRSKHAPTPYSLSNNKQTLLDKNGFAVATCITNYPPQEAPEDNAVFILQACNNHQDLINTLELILKLSDKNVAWARDARKVISKAKENID